MSLLSHTLFHAPKWVDYIQPFLGEVMPAWNSWSTRSKVVDVRHESASVFTLVLQPYTLLPLLKSSFSFKAGQYVALWMQRDGRFISRYFSISSSPAYFKQTGHIELTIQKQTHGYMTPWMQSALLKGGWVGLAKAQGKFVLPKSSEPLLFLAAGTGITPFRSFLQQLKSQDSQQAVHLVYVNRGEGCLFKNELMALNVDMPNLTIEWVNTKQQSRLNVQNICDLSADYIQRTAYICGPSGFIHVCQQALNSMGVASEQVNVEAFGAVDTTLPPNRSGDVLAHEGDVYFSHSMQQVHVDNQQTILNAAEAQGMLLNSGCRMGICKQCQCRKKSGVVYNVVDEQYSSAGEENIALCVSVPVGRVEVEA